MERRKDSITHISETPFALRDTEETSLVKKLRDPLNLEPIMINEETT